jgi:ABC-type transport system involved in Fe-S cluster assembly fused permease/ATPase subunit
VFKDGNIVEQGKHADLVASQGYYAELTAGQLTLH